MAGLKTGDRVLSIDRTPVSNFQDLLEIVTAEDPEAFYIMETARDVCRTLRPLSSECSGWRSVFKRK